MSPSARLLEAIRSGRHDDRPFPHRIRVEHSKGGGIILQEVLEPARSSFDLTLLRLATQGTISLDELARIYPDRDQLSQYLVLTMKSLAESEELNFAEEIENLIPLI